MPKKMMKPYKNSVNGGDLSLVPKLPCLDLCGGGIGESWKRDVMKPHKCFVNDGKSVG